MNRPYDGKTRVLRVLSSFGLLPPFNEKEAFSLLANQRRTIYTPCLQRNTPTVDEAVEEEHQLERQAAA
ncbi:UNVERIFIED_CONTAM: hypothetical protein HHA_461880 [Hammondia hammondi]|eukprot:XP_008883603.1 hypothetical protein HHA_461880 [Hammondia hammondi]